MQNSFSRPVSVGPYLVLVLLLAIACLPSMVFATETSGDENWPSFRGGDALSTTADDPRLPETWSITENVVWVRDVPGLGWSSPIVWGDTVFVTTVLSEGEIEEPKKGLYFGGNRMEPSKDLHHWMVYGIDRNTGKTLWEHEVHSGTPDSNRHLKNTYASETPVTDGERIYAYFGNQGIYAFTLEGEPVWSKELTSTETRYGWGTAASPIVHDGKLFVVNDNEEQSYLMALDAATGEELWSVNREEGSNWSTPYVWENELRTELVTPGTDQVRSYDLDGNLLWHLEGMSSITITQPFSLHGLLYISSGYIGDQDRPVYAVKPGATGDISLADGAKSNEYIVWFQPQAGPYNPTPLVYGDLYYTLLDRGFFTAHNALTGDEIYTKQRIARGAGAFSASPWAYNGKIFVLSEDGDTFVIEAGEEFKVIGTNSLDEMSMATPAISDGSLFLRTRTKLYRLSTAGE